MFNFDTPRSSMDFVIVLFRIFGVLIILFVLYKIVLFYMNDDGNWVFGRKSDKVLINATDIENDIHNTDYDNLIKDAVKQNDFRTAIRYYYLLSLKKLSKKEIIEWDSEKTNYDYYQEIDSKIIKKQFKYISYIYDYCWYGEFPIEKHEFSTSKTAFNKLFNELK